MVEVDCVDGTREAMALYEGSLEAGVEPLGEPCTRRAVMYTAQGAAAFAGSLLRACVRREPFPRHVAFDLLRTSSSR